MKKRRTISLEKRFWSKVNKTETCWLWTGTKRGYNATYGSIIVGWTADGKRIQKFTHRLAWEMKHGPIPEGMEICHTCDVPLCCRDSHLFLGTHTDNMRDMFKKGRRDDLKLSKPFALLSPSGDIVRGINLNRFCRENGLNHGHMNRVRIGKETHHKGWTRYTGE